MRSLIVDENPMFLEMMKDGTPKGIDNLIVAFVVGDESEQLFCGTICTTPDAAKIKKVLEHLIERIDSGDWERERQEVEVGEDPGTE